MHNVTFDADWSAQGVCWLSCLYQNCSLIYVFIQRKFLFGILKFPFSSLLIRFWCLQVCTMTPSWNRIHEPCVPGCRHAEYISYGSWICAIVSIRINTAVSLRSLVSFCAAFTSSSSSRVAHVYISLVIGSMRTAQGVKWWTSSHLRVKYSAIEVWCLLSSFWVFSFVNTSTLKVFWAIGAPPWTAPVTCLQKIGCRP